MKVVEFITDLQLTVLKDKNFRLAKDFYVRLDGFDIVIPEGFETDLASVPRLPLVFFLVGGRGHKAAVLHDWLLYKAMYTKPICDQYFYHALRENGVGLILAKAMYLGVKLGGQSWYRNHEINLEREKQHG